jgi:hypothetical protein
MFKSGPTRKLKSCWNIKVINPPHLAFVRCLEKTGFAIR